MDEQIIALAQTFTAHTINKNSYLQNFYNLLHGFDNGSQKKIMLLIKVLNVFSMIRYFKQIHEISSIRRDAFLKFFHNVPINIVRGGITGLRSLCLLAFYSLDENCALVGIEKKIKHENIN